MSDDELLTPGEIALGLTPERKRSEEEATGQRDVAAIEAGEKTKAAAAKTILDSARRLKRRPQMLGRVHSDI